MFIVERADKICVWNNFGKFEHNVNICYTVHFAFYNEIMQVTITYIRNCFITTTLTTPLT